MILLLSIIVCFGVSQGAESPELLSEDEVWILVSNTPLVIAVEYRKGCPSIELIPEGDRLMLAHIRNRCPASGSGMLDNYTVDRRTGLIWSGTDSKTYVDSNRLRRLRRILLRRRG
jgi:hypothetical protein